MSQTSASSTPIKVDPKVAEARRQQIAKRAKESLEKLQLNLLNTSLNLDVIQQYRRARPVEGGADSPTKQLEMNLEVEIQGLKGRIQTTKSLLDNLDDETLASPLSANDLSSEITQAFRKLSLDDVIDWQSGAPLVDKFTPKFDTSKCIDPAMPAAGEFAIPPRVLMTQVIDELDHKFHRLPKQEKVTLVKLDEDDYSMLIEAVDSQMSPLEGLQLIDDTRVSIRCGLIELCHRVMTMDGGRPESVLHSLHQLNCIATTQNQVYLDGRQNAADEQKIVVEI